MVGVGGKSTVQKWKCVNFNHAMKQASINKPIKPIFHKFISDMIFKVVFKFQMTL